MADYAARYSDMYRRLQPALGRILPWEGELLQNVSEQRRQQLPHHDLAARQGWRDRRLMALLAHQRKDEQ